MTQGPGGARLRSWALLIALVVSQVALFGVAVPTVAGAWPARFDQATFLARTYEVHEKAVAAGFWRAATEFVRTGFANGILTPVAAAALFTWTGPSRLAALSVNLALYAALAFVLFAVGRRCAGRTSAGFLAVGFLFLARTPFFWSGGLFDFRFDFPAACLYGIALCLVVASDGFARWRPALLAGAAAGACIATRFITLAYVAVLAALAAAALAFRLRGRDGARDRSIGFAAAVLACAAIAVPAVWWSRGAILEYYSVQHFGELGRVRAAALFSRGLPAFLAYYPYQALLRHAGFPLLVLAATLAFGVWRARDETAAPRNDALSRAAICVAAGFVVPAAVLTLGAQRQPDVATVLLVPILLGCVLAVARRGASPRQEAMERAGAAVAVALGLGLQIVHVARSRPAAELRDAEEIARLHDAAFASLGRGGREAPVVSVDRISDAFDATIFEAYAYERHGTLVRARHGLGASLLESPDPEVLAVLRASDLVLLTRVPAAKPLVFPFTRQMERLAPQLRAYCEANLVSEGRFRYAGGEVELFRRR